jgi:UDP-glucose 4-epimerase
VLRKKKAIGTYNIGSGYMINLKKIAELIAKKFNKLINIIDSRKRTYLIADNSKISKLNWKPKKNIINLEYFY